MRVRKVLIRVCACLGLAVCLWLAVIGVSPEKGLYPLAAISPSIYLQLAGKRPAELATFQYPDCVTSVAFSADGKALLAASRTDGTIYSWDVANGAVTASIKGHSQGAKCLAISPDGKNLAAVSRDGTATLWDGAGNKEWVAVPGGSEGIASVAFSPDSKTFAWTGGGRTIRLRNLLTARDWIIPEDAAIIAFNPDGKTLASASWDDKTVKVWEVASGKLTAAFDTDSGGGAIARGLISSLAFSPDGKTLAAGDMAGNINLWDVANDKMRSIEVGGGDNRCCVAFSPDGRTLASGSYFDEKVTLWDVKTGKELCALQRAGGGIATVVFSPDGRTLAAATTFTGAVTMWDVAAVLGWRD